MTRGVTMRALAIAAMALTMASGCSAGGGAEPAGSGAAVDVTPTCPETLDLPTGGGEPASDAPTIGAFDAAWVCVYGLGEQWTLVQGPAPIEDLDAVRGLVDGLEPADLMQPCTMELGPEYVLTLAGGEGLTRIVIDDYGCRWARVDGDPGVLATPEGIIADLVRLAGL